MDSPSRWFRWQLVSAFAIVYLVWGSTYLAIRLAIDTLPPLFMAGSRFVIAGAILFAWSCWRERSLRPRLTFRHLRSIAVIGAALLVGGNGGVVVAEQWVASGIAALVIAIEPLFVVVLMSVRSATLPSPRVVAGLGLGILGVGLLVPAGDASSGSYPLGILLILGAALSWAAGSLYASRADLPKSPHLVSSAEMLVGGVLLLGLSGVFGEWQALRLADVSFESWVAFGYLVIFGALIAFSAYSWLLRVAAPSAVATYAFVNPAIAVFLGWALGGEELDGHILLASLSVVSAVILITYGSHSASTLRTAPRREPIADSAGAPTLYPQSLEVKGPNPSPEPPRPLSKEGAKAWRRASKQQAACCEAGR